MSKKITRQKKEIKPMSMLQKLREKIVGELEGKTIKSVEYLGSPDGIVLVFTDSTCCYFEPYEGYEGENEVRIADTDENWSYRLNDDDVVCVLAAANLLSAEERSAAYEEMNKMQTEIRRQQYLRMKGEFEEPTEQTKEDQ